MMKTMKLCVIDLNGVTFDDTVAFSEASLPSDWALIDPCKYYQWHKQFGNNIIFCKRGLLLY